MSERLDADDLTAAFMAPTVSRGFRVRWYDSVEDGEVQHRKWSTHRAGVDGWTRNGDRMIKRQGIVQRALAQELRRAGMVLVGTTEDGWMVYKHGEGGIDGRNRRT